MMGAPGPQKHDCPYAQYRRRRRPL